jgi:hypothetical protein
MLSRRSLFSLIPTPLAGLTGLLTTAAEPSPVPDSDPVAEASLAVAVRLRGLARVPGMFDEMRAYDDGLGLSPAELDRYERRHFEYQKARLAEAEARLRPLLSGRRNLSVVIEGKVYSARNVTRSPVAVMPVWVALLTPSGNPA